MPGRQLGLLHGRLRPHRARIPNGTTGCLRSSHVQASHAEPVRTTFRITLSSSTTLPLPTRPMPGPVRSPRSDMTAPPITSTTSTTSINAVKRGQPSGGELPQSARLIRMVTPDTPIRSTSRPFIVNVINFLQKSPGLGRHGGGDPLRRLRRLVRPSDGPDCESIDQPGRTRLPAPAPAATAAPRCPASIPATRTPQGRCGYGPRQPLLVISPWATQQHG